MVIVAGCLRWKNNDGKQENVQYIIYICVMYTIAGSPPSKRGVFLQKVIRLVRVLKRDQWWL